MVLLAHVRMVQNVEPLGIGCHDAVFDAVVHHLHEMACAVWPAVKISLLSRSTPFFPARCSGNRTPAGSQGFENRIQVLNRLFRPANHETIPTLQPPDPTACPAIHVKNPLGSQFFGPPDVIDVVGISAIDDDVPLLHQAHYLV